MPVIVNIVDKRWKGYEFDFEKIAKAANIKGEISLTLTNDKEVQSLNKKYRGKSSPTNVLSFESGDKDLMGDIFISFDTVMKESPGDFINHVTHLVVHGMLHLQGLDHINDKDAEIMEAKEIKILKKLGIGNPYIEDGKRKMGKRAIFHILLGVMGAFGFAPYYLFPLTIISIGAAYYFNRGWRTGFWWGLGYGIANFHWALESIFANAELARQFWYFWPAGMIAIAIVSGLFFGLPFWMARFATHCPTQDFVSGKAANKIYPVPHVSAEALAKVEAGQEWRRVLYFALSWTLVLWLREWLLTGFPWNPLANITMPSIAISGIMSFVGALGLTFIISGCIAAIAEYIKSRSKWAFLFFVPLLIGSFSFKDINDLTDIKVRIVQPAFDMNQKFDRMSADDNIKTLVDLSVADNKPDLVIWPETAFPYAINSDVLMPPLGVPLIFGAIYYKNSNFYNSMALTDENGKIVDVYFKSHLVPFGEYRPLGDWLPSPGRLTPGPGPRVMAVPRKGGTMFAPAICYEIVFSDSLIKTPPVAFGDTRSAGPGQDIPGFIVNITNDAWFGTSSGPYQHLDMTRRQAIETGLSVIRANQSGISAIIDAKGRVIQRLELNESGVIDGYVPSGYISLYRRIGLHNTMLLIVVLSGMILVLFKKRKSGL